MTQGTKVELVLVGQDLHIFKNGNIVRSVWASWFNGMEGPELSLEAEEAIQAHLLEGMIDE